jgi:threonine-phosphate decarboxylase
MRRFDHGGDIFRAAAEGGLAVERIIDFSASINPLGISRLGRRAIRDSIKHLSNYPEPYGLEFAKALGASLGIDHRCIVPANGSTELIYLLPRAFRPKTVLIHNPTFSEYERASLLAGARMIHLKGIAFNRDAFADAIGSAGMAFLCNPNNPTGELLEREAVLEMAALSKKRKCLLVVDEAFADFCPGASVSDEAAKNPYLVVLRSMTKFHALTGLRMGYGVGHPSSIRRLQDFREPWSVNIPASEAALAAIGDTAHRHRTLGLIAKEKAFIERWLRQTGISFLPGRANFYLIRLKKAREFADSLAKKGILVRDCSNFRGLGAGWLRFAVKRRRENALLIEEIRRWAGK